VFDTRRGIPQKEHPVGRIDASEIGTATTVIDIITTYFNVSALTGTELTDAPLSALGAQ
jgi:hypothetical protein